MAVVQFVAAGKLEDGAHGLALVRDSKPAEIMAQGRRENGRRPTVICWRWSHGLLVEAGDSSLQRALEGFEAKVIEK